MSQATATWSPSITPPPMSCDSHAHVFGPAARYPLAAERDWTPPERPVEAYAAMLDSLGIARGVIVHSSSHGTDNSVTLDAIAHMGGRCVGIALLGPTVTDGELERLVAGGMCGVKRLASYPDLPAIAETLPRFRVVGVGILFAPARTPADVIQKLNGELDAIVKDPEYQKKLQSFRFTSLPSAGTMSEIAQFMKSERSNWEQVFQGVKIEPQ